MATIKAPYFDGTQVCAQVDPDLFFYETRREKADRVPLAKSLCNTCEFKDPCLVYALEYDVDGVWGATTPNERALIRKERRLPFPKHISSELESYLK